jgi:hypothetical protein
MFYPLEKLLQNASEIYTQAVWGTCEEGVGKMRMNY